VWDNIWGVVQVVFLADGKVMTVHKTGELHVYASIRSKAQVGMQGGRQRGEGGRVGGVGNRRKTYRWCFLTHPPFSLKQDYVTLLDIKDEVYSWWDHGLVSATFHPQFPQQPYLYIAVSLPRNRKEGGREGRREMKHYQPAHASIHSLLPYLPPFLPLSLPPVLLRIPRHLLGRSMRA